MASSSFTEDVLLAGITKDNTIFTTYGAIMPFINEILNLLTITIFKPHFNIEVYPHDPHTFKAHIRKTIIDTLAITGIIANIAFNGDVNTSKTANMVRGMLYAFFSFFVPNVFMSRVLSFKSTSSNLLAGALFILFLDLSVRTAYYYYVKYFEPSEMNEHGSKSVKSSN